MGLDTLLKINTERMLPIPSPETVEQTVRGGRYGELYTIGALRKQHALADEGSYFVTHNNQSALTGPVGTAFSATAAMLLIFNGDTAGSVTAKRIYLDYLALLAGATAMSNGTSNTGTFWAMVIDSGNRYASGGTNLTPNIVNANRDVSVSSVASVYFGAVTATVANAARAIVGQRLFREPVSATVLSLANMDDWLFNFGGVEAGPAQASGSSGVLQANIVHKSFPCPPIVIGPQQSLLIHMWLGVNSAPVAGTFLPELGWFER